MNLPSLRRNALIALSALLVASCSGYRYYRMSNQCSNGSHGNPDSNAPLVCVTTLNGVATPLIEPVHVYPHTKSNGTTSIHWKTANDTDDLVVEMDPAEQACAKEKGKVQCANNGSHCVAHILDNAVPGTQCTYRVWINGQTQRPDPVIIIDACCAGLDGVRQSSK